MAAVEKKDGNKTRLVIGQAIEIGQESEQAGCEGERKRVALLEKFVLK